MKSKAGVSYPVMMISGIIKVAVLAGIIYVILFVNKTIPLISSGDHISNYLELIGISFAVTFITTSLFGGLSDKTEKIFWLSYPEHYLINTNLNFNVLSSTSFICLGIETAAALMTGIDEYIREAVFLSAFIMGILSIVILSYKFTAVFFSRQKLLDDAEADFQKMVDDTGDKEELKNAVIGIFNNTLEAVSPEGSNMERVNENITLLLKYYDNETCRYWLEKLIIEIGRINISILIQLVYVFEDSQYKGQFSDLVETVGYMKNLPFDPNEILNRIYMPRFRDIKERVTYTLGSEEYVQKWEEWNDTSEEINNILRKIRTDNYDNCLFILEQLSELPYDLVKYECSSTVVSVWSDIVDQMISCVKGKDSVSFQKIEMPLFNFLSKHPAYYYDTDMVTDRIICYREQLGEQLNNTVTDRMRALSENQIAEMISYIEDEEAKHTIFVWMAKEMADGNLQEELWGIFTVDLYKNGQKVYLYNKWISCIIEEFNQKEQALFEEKLDADDIRAYDFKDFISKMTVLLSHVKKYEEYKYNNSLTKFLKAALENDYTGKAVIRVNPIVYDILLKEDSMEELYDVQLEMEKMRENGSDTEDTGEDENEEKRSTGK